MLKNYLKIAWRNIWKNKLFSLINVVGLSIGLSASFVIGVLIYYDLTFDKFHADQDRIYRVTTDWLTPEGEVYNRGVAVPLSESLKNDVAGIESVNTFFNAFKAKIENKTSEKVFKNVRDVVFADASYFKMFSYEWLSGNATSALSNPREVVLTKSRAAKYFPSKTPQQIVGNTLIYNDSILVKVSGVVADLKERSDFNFQEFLSLKTAVYSPQKNSIITDSWINTNSATQVFIKVRDKGTIQNIRTQLADIAKDHADENLTALGMRRFFNLQPLSDIHFNANYGKFNNGGAVANKKTLAGLALVALFLLLLGCANFINLNTAQMTKRAKEIGIRKTLGKFKKTIDDTAFRRNFFIDIGGHHLLFVDFILLV